MTKNDTTMTIVLRGCQMFSDFRAAKNIIMRNKFYGQTIALLFAVAGAAFLQSCDRDKKSNNSETVVTDTSVIHFAQEPHFKNVKQLTFGGENAEAYWSFDNTRLSFQHRDIPHGLMCDQIFMLNVTDSTRSNISSGKGRTTCSFFMPGD